MHGTSETSVVALAVALAGTALAATAMRLFVPSPQTRNAGAAAAACSLAMIAWAAGVMPDMPLFLVTAILAWSLAMLGAVDVFTLRLPDVINLPLICAGLAVCILLPDKPIIAHAAAALGAYALMAGLAWGFRALRGRESLGLGDAKLLAAAGAWLGPLALPSVVLLACAFAFVWVFARAAWKGRSSLEERIAFGAPLAFAFWITWLYGPLLPIDV